MPRSPLVRTNAGGFWSTSPICSRPVRAATSSPIARGHDLPRQYFLKLLENASATVCAELKATNPEAAGAIRDAVDEVATGLQHEARNTSQRFVKAMRDDNRTFNARPSPRPTCTRPRMQRNSPAP